MTLRTFWLISCTAVIAACGANHAAGNAPQGTPSAQQKIAASADVNAGAQADDINRPDGDEIQEVRAAAQIQSPKRQNWARRYDAPFLTIDPKGHTGKIKDVMFTRDGRYLVSASYDKTVRVWRTWGTSLVRTIRGQVGPGADGRIYAAALSPDDRYLALSVREGDRHLIRLLDFQSEAVLAVLSGHSDIISSLDFSPDSRFLVSASHDRTVHIWDAAARRNVRTLTGPKDKMLAAAFSADGSVTAGGGTDGSIFMWRTSDGRNLSVSQGHRAAVRALAFTPDGRYLVSGSDDRTIRLWDATAGRAVRTLASQNASVSSLAVSPDSTRVLTGCSGGETVNHIFEIPSGRQISSFYKHENIVQAVAFSPDGNTAVTAGGNDNEIYLWNPSNGETKSKISGAGKAVWSVGFSSDGGTIAWGKTFDQTGLSQYQLNGPLEQSFHLRNENTYDIYRAAGLYGGESFQRALESAGAVSVRTPNGKIHPTLQIIQSGRTTFEITRDVSSGLEHRCFTLTPNGRKVISGGANGDLVAYDTETGRVITEFIGHEGDLTAVTLSPDGRTLVSASADQTVRLWDVTSGRLLTTIFEAENGEWVAWTEEGYYTSSAYGDSYVGWQINRGREESPLFYSAATLSSLFRQPAVVGYYLGNGGLLEDALTLANQTYLVKHYGLSDVRQMAPPYIEMLEPSVRYSRVSNDRVKIRARAVSTNGLPITDMWVLVNGRRVGTGWTDTPRVSQHGGYAEIELDLYLNESLSRISVVAENQFAVSDAVSIEVRKTDEEITPQRQMDYKPNLYTLAIGIARHQDTDFSLRFAHDDAIAMERVMKTQSGKLFKSVSTRLLTDGQATRSAVIDGLDWLSRQATEKDIALIFLSGHGLKDDNGEYYFLPYDGEGDALARSAVKWRDFQNVMERIPAKVILMADTCHAGDITGSHRRAKGKRKDMTDALRDLARAGTGTVVLTASTGSEQSWEDDKWRHGAFTKALLDGLQRGADYNKDKVIYLKELDLFVTEQVKKLTGGKQHPTTEIPQTMPDFPLAYL